MALDITLIILGGLCVVVGVIGCVLPVLPGPIMGYAGLILLQLSSRHPFTVSFLVLYAVLTALVAFLDYVIPIYGTKKLEGSKYGIWGSTAGLVLGLLFFFPFGLLLGPMLGAFIGELISGKTMNKAFKSALGSFLGFLASTAIKLTVSLSMAYYFGMTVYTLYIT